MTHEEIVGSSEPLTDAEKATIERSFAWQRRMLAQAVREVIATIHAAALEIFGIPHTATGGKE